MTYKKIIISCLLLLSVLSIGYSQTWVQKTDIPISGVAGAKGRIGSFSFTINNKVYVGGGDGSFKNAAGPATFFNDFYEYDPTIDKWSKKADLPGANNRSFGVSFSINGKGYIGMGREGDAASSTSTLLPDLWEYNPVTDKWTKKSDFPLGGIESSKSFVISDKAYILGGDLGGTSGRINDLWEYDIINDKWTQKADFPNVVLISVPMTFSAKGKGFVTCGGTKKNYSDPITYTNKTFEYDPVSDTWSQKANFPGNVRTAGVAFVINNKAFCGLGTGDFVTFYSDIFEYDVQADKWSTSMINLDTSIKSRVTGFAEVANNRAYFGGGWSHDGQWYYYNDFYEFSHPVFVEKITKSSLLIYPNPANKYVHIKSDSKFLKYELIDFTGKLVSRGLIDKNNTIIFNGIPVGNYIVKATNDLTGEFVSSVLTIN